MEFEYRLLKYTYKHYVQGDYDRVETYALIHCPRNVTFADVKNILFRQKHREYFHEIDMNSIQDLTIFWLDD